MKNGQVKITREQYDRSKKILDRSEEKVFKAKALVQRWDTVEAKNKDKIGKNVLMAILTDSTGKVTIRFESPAQLDQESASGKPA